MKSKALLLAALALAGCGYLENGGFDKERADKAYRAAMNEYRAGHMQAAREELAKVCKADPANASARFQYACILQDYAKDYFGAACEYREYMRQHPESDKKSLAKSRFDECERLLAQQLSEKYGFNDAGKQAKETELVRTMLKESEQRAAKIGKDLTAAMHRVAALVMENDRLKNSMREDLSEETVNKNDLKDAKALLNEEEDVAAPDKGVKDAKALLMAEDEAAVPLIAQAPDAKAKRDAAKKQAEQEKALADATAEKLPNRPDTYIVQKDDTLYKIAIKFYGRSSAWSKIRDANKVIISTDGRIRAGQKIVLPK